jgi:hypothetical protein
MKNTQEVNRCTKRPDSDYRIIACIPSAAGAVKLIILEWYGFFRTLISGFLKTYNVLSGRQFRFNLIFLPASYLLYTSCVRHCG